jgi:CRISPR system Cascade subunit CasB
MTTISEHSGSAQRRGRNENYVRWVEQVCRDDPGARSALRRGLGRGLDDVLYTRGMHRLVARWLPAGGDTPVAEQRAYYTVASLIAAQPRHTFTQHVTAEPAEPAGTDAPLAAGASDSAVPDAGDAEDRETRARQGESLGVAFAHAVLKAGGGREMRLATAETRLNLLTRQSLDGIHRYLPPAVRFLRDADAPIDFAQLLVDLTDWPVGKGRISRRWLQDFYALLAKAPTATANAADVEEAHEPDDQQ